MVKGWRNKENGMVDRPYVDVRREIEAYLAPPPKQGEVMPAESANTVKPAPPTQASGPVNTPDPKTDPKASSSNAKPTTPPKP
jgi:hypothetical protein